VLLAIHALALENQIKQALGDAGAVDLTISILEAHGKDSVDLAQEVGFKLKKGEMKERNV
jgi:hypothetical protein